jgi:2-deoxy-D-gluconate 3-dehydrogenase
MINTKSTIQNDDVLKPLKDKTTMITGASRGIGYEIACTFAQAGSNLVVTEITERFDALLNISHSLKDEYKVQIMPIELDVRNYEQIQRCISDVNEYYDNIDILINNAGINILCSALDVKPEQWDEVVDVNIRGAFFVTQAVAKLMIIKKRQGSIINIASQHGVVGNELRAAYCSSKAGLINLTKSLSIEWARHNIRVNAISPTFVLTNENDSFLNEQAFKRCNLSKIPLRRFALPSDIAQAALYLASNAANMITGHNLVVDGGWTVQ